MGRTEPVEKLVTVREASSGATYTHLLMQMETELVYRLTEQVGADQREREKSVVNLRASAAAGRDS